MMGFCNRSAGRQVTIVPVDDCRVTALSACALDINVLGHAGPICNLGLQWLDRMVCRDRKGIGTTIQSLTTCCRYEIADWPGGGGSSIGI